MTDRSDLVDLIYQARYNPTAILEAQIDRIEKTYNGELELVDATNPFISLMEAGATIGSAQMRQGEYLLRRLYPELSQSFDDLYHHMSDSDYIGRFATPAAAVISFLMGKEEVMAKAVATQVNGVRRLTLPRHTCVTVAGVPFTFQYPVDIRVMAHGGFQIVYNNDQLSPLYDLETNQVDWSIENYNTNHDDYLRLNIPLKQFKINSFTAVLTGSKVYSKTFTVTDQYYHCRAFSRSSNGGAWTEIRTTHSQQVFDPLYPTVLLQVNGQQVTATVPQVYFTSGLMQGELRLDIYTTKGVTSLNLSGYDISQFNVEFLDYDNLDNGKYSAPLGSIVQLGAFSTENVSGGTNGLTFDELKARVMTNAYRVKDLPITNAEIGTRLQDLGFSCTPVIDNATKRLFLATREIPKPTVGTLSTGIGSNMLPLFMSVNRVAELATVSDNGNRLTILPSTLYQENNGVLSIVPDYEVTALKALSPEVLAERVTGSNYLYTPFHYVYDMTSNTFDVRAYYFGVPGITRKRYVDDNDTLGMGISTNTHALSRTATGWKLQVMTNSTDSLKTLSTELLHAQLSFRPTADDRDVFIEGTVVGRDPNTNEWIFEFTFDTTWDIDANHNLYLQGFTADGISSEVWGTKLEAPFQLLFAVEGMTTVDTKTSSIDTNLGKHLLPDNILGIYQEQLTLHLGDHLEGLWTQARTVIGQQDYQTYPADVYKTYTETQWLRDPITQKLVITNDPVTGKPSLTAEHQAGDIVLDGNGNPEILHAKGSTMFDIEGNPIVINQRTLQHLVDLCLFDGVYYFATAGIDTDYRDSIPQTVVNWVNTTLAPVRSKLLEETKLLFHPKSSIGLVSAQVDTHGTVVMEAAQSLRITYYVPQKVYRDDILREQIRQSTVTAVARLLQTSPVTCDSIEATLKAESGDNVAAVAVEGLGGVYNARVVSLTDASGHLVIGKTLQPLPDGTYGVEEDLTVVFEQHGA